jgi:hypothetical protein
MYQKSRGERVREFSSVAQSDTSWQDFGLSVQIAGHPLRTSGDELSRFFYLLGVVVFSCDRKRG